MISTVARLSRMEVEIEMSVEVVNCESWDDFIRRIRGVEMTAPRAFRGQRDPCWPLASRWERYLARLKGDNPTRNVREAFEDGAFERHRDLYVMQFRDLVRGLPELPQVDLSDQEYWALGRGIPECCG